MPRLRFSLRAFLLVLIITSLVASNVFTSWQLYQLREENAQMRKELGRLVVKDREKINVVAVPTYEDLTWRWRIYLPPGKSLHLCSSTQDIPEHGFPTNPGQSGPLPNGEYVLTAAVRPDRNGNWQITLAAPHSSYSIGIAAEHSGWLSDSIGWSTEQAGSTDTDVLNPDGPITLLRLRTMKKTSPTTSSTTPDPSEGVLLWLRKQ